MTTTGKYDAMLQMFVEAPHDVDLRHLAFLRWLGVHGKLEHAVAGPSSGPDCESPTEQPVRAA